MRALNRFVARLRNFIRGRRSDERLSEEMESHLAIQMEEGVRAGMSPEEARRQARLKFGAADAIREDYHAEESLPFVEHLLLDVRYALRVLRKSPAFTAVALVTLALGIATNVVVFGVLNEVVLRPLDVSDPQGLYQVRQKQWANGRLLTTSYPAFEDFRRRNTTFSGMAGVYGYSAARLNWCGTVSRVHGDEVTGEYFDLLGAQPELGRFFHTADAHGPSSTPYVVLSHRLWQSVFHGDRDVVGTTVDLDKRPFTVVGVAEERFHGAERFVWPDYWIPMENSEHSRTAITVTVIGRLKPGVTPQQAAENLNAISAELAKEYPSTDPGLPVRLIHAGLLGDAGEVIRGFLYSVTVLALLVLAAACANLASLFAARVADRSRELALRVALGSSRRRLVRQLLTEAAMVSLLGGAAGLGCAGLLLSVLNRWRPLVDAHVAVHLNARLYLAGLALALGSALLFGLIPARQVWRSSPLQMMKSGPAMGLRFRRFALRDLLLGAQIAICTLLVTASLVAVQSMVRTLHMPLGIQPQGAMLVGVELNETGQTADAALQREMIEAARGIPGVTAAGMVNRTPFTGGLHGVPVYRPGTTEFKLQNSAMTPYVFAMSPGYLEAAGTRLLRGRDVSWHDSTGSPYVAVVNETFARKMWGYRPAMGQRFILWGNLTEVVGVAENGKYHDLEESPQAVAYVPLSQHDDGEKVFVVRSRLEPKEMAASLRPALSGFAPNVPVTAESWAASLDDVLLPARAATVSLGVMGGLAAMLAVTGIFGMAAYSVSRRMKELGIRVALGARRSQVMRAAVGRPMVLLGVGSAAGLLGGMLASRLLGQIVYQANPKDPVVVGGAVVTMVLLGIAASAIPARRAMGVDPARLMREE